MNVLITGASKGIGKNIAKQFAPKKPVTLFLLSRSAEALADLERECKQINPGAVIHCIAFDLNNLMSQNLPEILENVHFDCVINNAGLLIHKEFDTISSAEMLQMLTTNFMAPALLIQKILPFQGGGSPSHIVNIASMGGFQGSVKFPGLSIYSASKAALAVLTECLAEELKNNNIFFNCLALGAVQTEMLDQAFPGYKAPLTAGEMASYIVDFALSGYRFFNGKVLPVSVTTP